MSYINPDNNAKRHKVIGLALVVGIHVMVLLALQLGQHKPDAPSKEKSVAAVLLEEDKSLLPPPPKKVPPPPANVPPAEVPVQPAPSAIEATTIQPVPEPSQPEPPAPPVRIPGGLSAKVNCPSPVYPRESLRNAEEGMVVLRFLVSELGNVIESQVKKSSGFGGLDEAAREALSLCAFVPETLDGKPQRSWLTMKYLWRIRQ